jgi:hypothetical protein
MNSVSGNCAATIAMATPGANSATQTIDTSLRVKSYFLRLPEPISFRPGQYVVLRLTHQTVIAPW